MSLLDTIRQYLGGNQQPQPQAEPQTVARRIMPPTQSFASRLSPFRDDSALGIVRNTFSPSSLRKAFWNAPKFTFADRVKWSNPVVKLPAEMLQSTMNIGHGVRDYAAEAMDQYSGKKPYDFGALAGKGLNASIGLAGLGFGGNAVANAAKAGLRGVAPTTVGGLSRTIANQAWKGSKLAGRFGAAQGLADSLTNHESVSGTIRNMGQGYFGGRAIGFGLGFGASAVPALGKAAAGSLSKNLYRTSGKYPYFTKTAGQIAKAVPESMKMAPRMGMGIEDVSGKRVNEYLQKAYKVYSGQKPENIVAQLADDVTKRTGLPKDVVVKKAFFDKMAESHPEIDRGKLFSFVRTLNIPESVYQLPQKNKLNFFRTLEARMTNIVGTNALDDHQVVTSFITSSDRYPKNIKKTAEAVFERSAGGALTPSSLMQSPPAGARPNGLSGVSDISNEIIPNNAPKVNIPNPKLASQIVMDHAKRKSVVPMMSGEEAEASRNFSQYVSENPKNFEGVFDRWIGRRDSARTKGYLLGDSIKNVSDGEAWNVVNALEGTAKTKNTVAVNQIRGIYDNLFKKAKAAGVDVRYLKDYVTHIWKESPEQVAETFRSASGKFKFAKERTLPTYAEGIELGLTPKYTNPRQIVAEYGRKLEEAIANADMIRDLQKSGLVVDASVGAKQPGFAPIIAPGLQKNMSSVGNDTKIVGHYYAPRELAAKINRIFSPEDMGTLGSFLDKSAKTASTLQDISMSGGIPKTPFNAFTVANMQKDALSGRISSPVKSFFTSLSGGASDRFFKENADQIIKMQERNIPVSSTLDVDSLAGGTFAQKAFTGVDPSKWEKIKSVWHKSMNEPTFRRFMPQLQIRLFNDIEKQSLRKGKTESEAADIAAKAVANFYGIVGSGKMARRTKIAQDFSGTVFFAPRYREAMINFWINNAKALRHPFALENRQNLKFVAGSLAMYAAYDYANKALNGVHIWENPTGKTDKLLVPDGDTTIGVPYLSSIATVPRALMRESAALIRGDISGAGKDALQTYSSSLVKPVADMVKNEDYFGNPITEETDTPGEKWGKLGSYALAQYAGHPYVKAAQSAMSGKKPGYQVASQAMELPFRFYKSSSLTTGKFWDRYNDLKPYNDKYARLLKTAPEEAKTFYDKNAEKIDSYKNEILPMYRQYRQLKEAGAQGEFGKYLKGGSDSGAPRESNGYVLYKGPDGLVKSLPKADYDRQLLAAKMTAADSVETTKEWLALAQERYNAIEKTLASPELDPLDRAKLENERRILVKKAAAKLKRAGKKTGGTGARKSKKAPKPPTMRLKKLPKLQTSIRGRAKARKKLTLKDLYSVKTPKIV